MSSRFLIQRSIALVVVIIGLALAALTGVTLAMTFYTNSHHDFLVRLTATSGGAALVLVVVGNLARIHFLKKERARQDGARNERIAD